MRKFNALLLLSSHVYIISSPLSAAFAVCKNQKKAKNFYHPCYAKKLKKRRQIMSLYLHKKSIFTRYTQTLAFHPQTSIAMSLKTILQSLLFVDLSTRL